VKKFIIFLTIFFTACANNSVVLSGYISVKGSSPHNYITFTTKDNSVYYIVNPKSLDLIKLQNQELKIEAKILKKFKSSSRLKAIEVIKVIK